MDDHRLRNIAPDEMGDAIGWRDDQIKRLRRELAEARRDAARFDWFFGVADKRPFMKTYVDGIAAGYTVTQWRAAIDAALAEPKEVPK